MAPGRSDIMTTELTGFFTQMQQEVLNIVENKKIIFALTHNYTGYPMVRHARSLIQKNDLGSIRVVQAEYPQDWLTTKAEDSGLKQAEWRTDPKRSGGGGCIGDIGTHAFNLIRFITRLEVDELSADIHTFVKGRLLDDNAQIMLRFKGGTRGSIWSSQVAVGNVTMNRVTHSAFPDTVCDVVWERKQFSWTHDGKSDTPSSKSAYDEVYEIAKAVYNGNVMDITEGATFYHADYVNPSWNKDMKRVAKIDTHIFYTHKGR